MERKYKCLDLFCCGGGAAKGYHDAGFEIHGVDIVERNEYPYDLTIIDAMEILDDETFIKEFDFIHASPPCQHYSKLKYLSNDIKKWDKEHPDLIEPVREKLKYYNDKYGIPYVIENVVGSPLINPIELNGSMFPYMYTQRPRLFESSIKLTVPNGNKLNMKTSSLGTISETGAITIAGKEPLRGLNKEQTRLYYQIALGGECQWMTLEELTQCIPPQYTCFIGKQIIEYLKDKEKIDEKIKLVLTNIGVNPQGIDIKQLNKMIQNIL